MIFGNCADIDQKKVSRKDEICKKRLLASAKGEKKVDDGLKKAKIMKIIK